MTAVKLELPAETLEEIARRAAEIIAGQDPGPEPWVGVADAADHLGCKRQRVYDLVHKGRVPHCKEGGRLVFKRSELDEWLERGG